MKSIHSDQGANMCGEVVQGICNLLKIDRTRTSAYHPMGNGQVERFNRTVEAMLAKMVKESQRDWDRHLQKALFAYRTSLHETMGSHHITSTSANHQHFLLILSWDSHLRLIRRTQSSYKIHTSSTWPTSAQEKGYT